MVIIAISKYRMPATATKLRNLTKTTKVRKRSNYEP